MKKCLFITTLLCLLTLAATTAAQAWTAAGRFVDNTNGTVSDTVTSLMWQQTDDGTTRTWVDALAYCEGLSLGGHSDWRLPNIKELSSLVDDGVYSPAINSTYFPGTASSNYWSSSSLASYTNGAWYVDFYYGFVNDNNKTNSNYARCVRP